jgi:hypothetical protein
MAIFEAIQIFSATLFNCILLVVSWLIQLPRVELFLGVNVAGVLRTWPSSTARIAPPNTACIKKI